MVLDQKTRDKVALVLTIVLVPVMIFMFVTNIRKARAMKYNLADASQVAAPAQVPDTTVAAIAVPAKPAINRIERKLDVHTVDEQKKMANAQPKCNPFSVSRAEESGISNRPVELKPVRLTGVVQRMSGEQCMAVINGMVVINGKVFKEGDRVEGWKIAKINKNSIILDNGEKQITVNVK